MFPDIPKEISPEKEEELLDYNEEAVLLKDIGVSPKNIRQEVEKREGLLKEFGLEVFPITGKEKSKEESRYEELLLKLDMGKEQRGHMEKTLSLSERNKLLELLAQKDDTT